MSRHPLPVYENHEIYCPRKEKPHTVYSTSEVLYASSSYSTCTFALTIAGVISLIIHELSLPMCLSLKSPTTAISCSTISLLL